MADYQVSNRKGLREERKALRTFGTAAEAVLWTALKARKLDGWRWRRQFSIGSYILDFYCPKAKLCVELDGASHFTPYGLEADSDRSQFLAKLGIRVLRFENRVLKETPESVIEAIRSALNETTCENGHFDGT
ncbi:MAG: endonuclease domain-containing protein [Bacteroidales bacterium]|nr:endonuclease domain-containing protein [Bacteroidales bacterium]